jgi:aminopeptidase N
MSGIKNCFILLFILITYSCFSQLDFGKDKKFTKADSLRGTLSPMRKCYDVLSYDLDVKVDIENKFISGSNTIKFKSVSDFKTLQVDLFENMKIEKIEFKDVELKYTRLYTAVFIDFPDIITKGSVSFIKIHYSGNPQPAKNAPWDGGFTWAKDKEGNPFVGVSCQGTGASLWWPCKDHQSDEPNEMVIRITVPTGLTDISNGRLKKETDLKNGWTKFEWYVSYPINNYDVTLNIGKYKHFSDYYYNSHYSDTLSLDYFVLPINYEKAVSQFTQVKPMLDAYYNYFGEYPFVRDGYKLVEAPYLGMEHQSCVEYGNKYKNGYLGYDRSGTGNKFDYIIIHESAHEWWGNSITTNDLADMWIHEGFGTYSEALYIEYLYGHDAYLEYINSEKKSIENDSPICGKYDVNNEGSGDMYPKGALLLHTIRSIINDDKKFFEIIRGIQETFKYQTINSSDIENYISKKSGYNFTSIFNIYLHCQPIPILNVKIFKDFMDTKATYSFSFKNNSLINNTSEYKGFTMPVKITTDKNTLNFIYPIAGKEQTINLYDMKPEDFKIATDLFYIKTEIEIIP